MTKETRAMFSDELLNELAEASQRSKEKGMKMRSGRTPSFCNKILAVFKAVNSWCKISEDGFIRVAIIYLWNDMKKDKYGTIKKLKKILEK